MKYFLFVLIFCAGCDKSNQHKIIPGECVLGPDLAVWQLLRVEDKKHLFTRFPGDDGSKVEMVEDISTLKKIKCPLEH